ncbi:dephospho-CoA kinase [Oscillospiraceae bacterium PP1C4]
MNEKGTLVIGLTGQTGAGKSTLSRMFEDRGLEILDADRIARETIETSTECLMNLVLEFSTEVIHPDATLNREKLAMICFSDKQKLKRLNEITFPYIIEAIRRKLEDAGKRNVRMAVLDAPTLFESGLDKRCDCVIAVIADKEMRIKRIIARDGLTAEAAQRRVNAQNADEFYTSRADYILTNDEDLDTMRFWFMDVYGKLEKMETDGCHDNLQEKASEESTQADTGDFGELVSENE